MRSFGCAKYHRTKEMARADFWVNDALFQEVVEKQFNNWSNNAIPLIIEDQTMTIPKVLNFVWLGSELPFKFKRMIDTWTLHNPSYVIRVWNDELANSFMADKCLKSVYDCTANYGKKSDVLRYEILLHFGGLYIDIDYECVQALTFLNDRACSFFCGMSNTGVVEINNGIIGCTANHPLMQSIVNSVKYKDSEAQDKAIGTLQMTGIMSFLSSTDMSSFQNVITNESPQQIITATGPGMFTRSVSEYLVNSRSSAPSDPFSRVLFDTTVVFPVHVFHPVPNFVKVDIEDSTHMDLLKNEHVLENTVAIHWWQCSWQEK